MSLMAPSLQSLALKSMIIRERIIPLLNPEEDWDNDVSHLYNTRFNYKEVWAFEARVMDGKETLADIKMDMRCQLYGRPWDLDLIHLRSIEYFNELPDHRLKQIWVEACIISFEMRLAYSVKFYVQTRQYEMDWHLLNSIMDGCEDQELLDVLKEFERELVVNDIVVVWLLENQNLE